MRKVKDEIKRENNQIKSVEEPKSVVCLQPQLRSSRAAEEKKKSYVSDAN